MRLLPKWVLVLGLGVAVVGELSWFTMLTQSVGFLVPLTTFPAYVWLIATGFARPTTTARVAVTS